jgi:hypothetical protein
MANRGAATRNLKEIVQLVASLAADAPRNFIPLSEGTRPTSEHVLAFSHVRDTRRGYLIRVVNQINGCYEKGWFDGCAVMMRRFVETLIIECFEAENIAQKIKDARSGEFLFLKDLIDKLLQEQKFNLGRVAKKGLVALKEVGDLSAHSRRYNANREDIDKVTSDFRIVCQELIYLAKLK